jgi:hypothetical protein
MKLLDPRARYFFYQRLDGGLITDRQPDRNRGFALQQA